MSCAYYLTLGGCQVKVFAAQDRPGGKLWEKSSAEPLLRAAVERDVQGVISSGIDFYGIQSVGENLDVDKLLTNFSAVYLAEVGSEDATGAFSVWLGSHWRDSIDPQTRQVAGHPGLFTGEEFLMNGVTVVEAAARGRTAAATILQFLS